MKKIILIFPLILYYTTHTAEKSLSNETIQRTINDLTTPPKPKEPQSQKYAHSIKIVPPTITNVKKYHNIMPAQSTQPAKL